MGRICCENDDSFLTSSHGDDGVWFEIENLQETKFSRAATRRHSGSEYINKGLDRRLE